MWKDVPHCEMIMGDLVWWYDKDEQFDDEYDPYLGLSYFEITGRGEGC